MARFQPRANIYTLLPILATLIMAAGITFTWMRIQEYQRPEKPTDLPPAKGRQFPDPPAAGPVDKAPGAFEDVKGEESGEAPPDAPAPEVKEKTPDEAPPMPKAEEEEEK